MKTWRLRAIAIGCVASTACTTTTARISVVTEPPNAAVEARYVSLDPKFEAKDLSPGLAPSQWEVVQPAPYFGTLMTLASVSAVTAILGGLTLASSGDDADTERSGQVMVGAGIPLALIFALWGADLYRSSTEVEVSARLPGYRTERRMLRLPGAETDLRLVLEPDASPPPEPPGGPRIQPQ